MIAAALRITGGNEKPTVRVATKRTRVPAALLRVKLSARRDLALEVGRTRLGRLLIGSLTVASRLASEDNRRVAHRWRGAGQAITEENNVGSRV